MRLIAVLMALILSGAAMAEDDLHAPWDRLLDAYVTPGADGVDRFDYDALRGDEAGRAALEAYIAALEAQPVGSLARDEQFALWANLYNAVTVRLIVEESPSRSILQIRPTLFSIGPWRAERVTVEGRALSLDDIEHGIMRPQFEAALVHYAVNCASIGCPNIRNRAWRADTLAQDLDAAARAYVNHPRGVSVTQRGLVISRIYKWYEEDFGGDDAGVIAHLLRYAEPELAEAISARPRIVRHAYDWSLNRPD
ncbi:DUF547 domain-containing protein [Alkalicaulis satelles]|uniref:DUF547 domain-containing protein n=1 Tax=Alkalicaulis satelles TaxID=2609175 RepID=A0A5M6ZJF9_9PROT|nr:DUF547 domain-containing protein [Alkalicaulis satelles]KAA5804943.1 DUF547 domain-containing protein [Alkalicaulis satelles]